MQLSKSSFFYTIFLSSLIFALFSFSFPVASQSEVNVDDPRIAQREALISMFTRNYSNFHPLFNNPEAVGNYPPIVQRGFERQLTSGEKVVILEQSFLDNSRRVYRKQLVRFTLPQRSDGILQITYPLPVEELLLSRPIQLAQYERLPGCEIRWSKEGAFEGFRSHERCYFLDENEQKVHLESHFLIDDTQFELLDTEVNEDGEPVSDEAPAPLTLEPIRFLQLDASFLPAGADASDSEVWISVQTASELHDHGQRTNLLLDERSSSFQLRVAFVPEDPSTLNVTLFSAGDELPLEQWTIQKEGYAWTQHEPPLRFTLKEIN